MSVKKPETLDAARIAKMQAPLTLRVERIKGNLRQPIELPLAPGDDGMPSDRRGTIVTNLKPEDILNTERNVVDIAGGGSYTAKVQDANGDTYEWGFSYYQFPEKAPIAPPAVGPTPAALAPLANVTTAPVYAGTPAPSLWGQGLGGYAPSAPAPVPAAPAPVYAGPGWNGGWAPPPPVNNAAATAAQQQAARLEDQIHRMERERQEERHRHDAERREAAHQQELAAMRAEMAKLGEALQRKPAAQEDERFLALQAELQREREERKRDEERRERERADERHRAELAAMNQRMETMMAQFSSQIAAVAAKGPDPMVEFMKEQARQQAEAQREQARLSQIQLEKMAGLSMNPLQLIELIEKKGSSADVMMQNVIGSFGAIFETYRGAMEHLTQVTGGAPEPPLVGVLKDGLAGAQNVLGRFMRAKEAEANAAARAQEANAHAQAAQAQAFVMASRQAAQGAQNANPVGTPYAGAATMNGATVAPAGVAEPESPSPLTPEAGAPAAAPAPLQTIAGRNGAPTDEELFGAALGSVQQLRAGVRNGLTPEQVADIIIQASAHPAVSVAPAFGLFTERKFELLVEALIPDAPTGLQLAVVELLAANVPVDGDGPDDEEEDEEEEEENGEDGIEAPPAAALPAAPPVAVAKPNNKPQPVVRGRRA